MAPRVALVHDFLLDLRGAERVFAAICDAWPEADVFTAVYDEHGTEGRFAARDPRSSFLQHIRPTSHTFRPLLPLYPHAIESLDLRGYDVVVSSSSAWAHGVRVDPDTAHVCYCHNPFRYAWAERDATLAARPWPLRAPLRAAARSLARVGSPRGPTGEQVRGELLAHRRPRARLLQSRGGRAAPPGGSRPLLARAGRRPLPRGRRAHGPQAHRRRGGGLQPAAARRSSSWATGRRAAACAASPARPSRSRAACRIPRWRASCAVPGPWW